MSPQDYYSYYYKKHEELTPSLFPPIPNDFQNKLTPIEVLILIKELKPEALETYFI